MKKLTALFFAFTIIATLFACAANKPEDGSPKPESSFGAIT